MKLFDRLVKRKEIPKYKKVYCEHCKYLEQVDLHKINPYCFYNYKIISSFYTRKKKYRYACEKNRENNCKHFKLLKNKTCNTCKHFILCEDCLNLDNIKDPTMYSYIEECPNAVLFINNGCCQHSRESGAIAVGIYKDICEEFAE